MIRTRTTEKESAAKRRGAASSLEVMPTDAKGGPRMGDGKEGAFVRKYLTSNV